MPKGKPSKRTKWWTITDSRKPANPSPKETPQRKDGMTIWPKPKEGKNK